ncbi:MAG: AAA family ATPase [Treponema sp.]|nr:AAA family ATPase [Treponema sp.]
MKPLNLILENIGPFRHEEIDFTRLGEIFLIFGSTGAGKSTIFDAITYAFYGDLCGSRKNKVADFRSNFAIPSDKGCVTFTFDLNGSVYRITRTLPVILKNGKKSPQELSLEKASPPKNLFTSIEFVRVEGKLSELDAKIKSLIGLKIEEFTRIVLLPQGAFAQFLKDNSLSRRDTLSKLFPIEKYQAVMETAKKKSSEYQTQIKFLEQEISHLESQEDFSVSQEKLEVISSLLAEKNEERIHLALKISEESTKIENLRHLIENSQKKAELSELLARLNEQKNQICIKEGKLKKSVSAEKLSNFVNQTRKLAERNEKNQQKLSSAQNNLEELKKEWKIHSEKSGEILELKSKLDGDKKYKFLLESQFQSLEKLKQLVESRKSLEKITEKSRQDLCNINENLGRLQNQIIEKLPQDLLSVSMQNLESAVLQKLNDVKDEFAEAEDIFKAANEFLDAQKKNAAQQLLLEQNEESVQENQKLAENAKKCLEDYESEKKAFEDSQKACALVNLLFPGKPCPVCGSTEHPSPASEKCSSLNFDEKIETQAKLLEKLSQEQLSLARENSGIKQNLKILGDQLETLCKKYPSFLESSFFSEIEQDFACKKLAASETEKLLSDLKPEISEFLEKTQKSQEVQAEFEKNQLKVQGMNENIFAALAGISKILPDISITEDSVEKTLQFVQNELTSLKQKITDSEQKISDYNDRNLDLTARQTALETTCDELHKVLAENQHELEEALSIQEEKIAMSEFSSAQEVLDNLLSEKQTEFLKTEIEHWHQEHTRLSSQLETLKDCQPLDQLKLKRESSITSLKKLQNQEEELINLINSLTEEKTLAENALKNFNSLQEKLEKAREEGNPYITLSENLEGRGINSRKVPFDAWVLGMYFAEVIRYANPRFERISGGRYKFKINSGSGGGNALRGLDLLVSDAFTGTDRDTATLSGGETFMASISLALAITDVVQAQNGGIRLDSIFIDEGFGSLDSESLDKAISILKEIGENRTVGIISHVESLLPAIPSHIEVVKNPDGSRIK